MPKAFMYHGQMVKVCPKCANALKLAKEDALKAVYPIDRFNKDKSTADGLTNQCKECQKAQSREYYHKKKAAEPKKTKQAANMEVVRELTAEELREAQARDDDPWKLEEQAYDTHMPKRDKWNYTDDDLMDDLYNWEKR